MVKIDLESYPPFVWVRNPRGLVVEVAKEKLPELLNQGFQVVSMDVDTPQDIRDQIPKSRKVYLTVEEL
jgi:hypothetical protein